MNKELKLNNPHKTYVPCPHLDCDELVEIVNENTSNMVKCHFNHRFCTYCQSEFEHNLNNCQNVT